MTFILDITGTLTVFIFSMFAFLLVKKGRTNKLSNLFFSGFLFANIVLIIFSVLFRNEIFVPKENILVYYFIGSFFFLLAPFLYLYFLSSINNLTSNPKYYLSHFAIPLFCFTSLITEFYLRNNHLEIGAEIYLWTNISYHIFLLCLNLQNLIYLILILKLLLKYNTKVKSNYSNLRKAEISWYFLVLLIFVAHWILDIFAAYSAIWFSTLTATFEILSIFVLLVFASIIVYRGLKNEPFFMITHATEKYHNSNITEQQKDKLTEELKLFMSTSKPYLSPNLTLSELANMLDIHPKYLSQIINENFQQNFFDFVNSYRVEEAKEKLGNTDENNDSKTILEILFEVGFNSKSAFNRAFKKQIGLTPTQFRKGEV